MLQPTVQPKVIFTKQQYEFLKICFHENAIPGSDPGVVNKLLIREGTKAVLEMVQKHIPLDQR